MGVDWKRIWFCYIEFGCESNFFLFCCWSKRITGRSLFNIPSADAFSHNIRDFG